MRAILTYHSIDDSGSPISVTPERFAAHHAWFLAGGVPVLPLDELVARSEDAGDAVAVTFDDGFDSVCGAVERLHGDGLPATVFVVSGHVGGTNDWGGRPQSGIPTLPLMEWRTLERLAGLGATVASHTRTHPRLTQLTLDAQTDELFGCHRDLEERLGLSSRHVCYPYGDVDEAVAARAAACYQYGHTTDFRFLSADDDVLRLPRLDMYYFRAPGALEAWGRPAFRRRVRWCQLRRQIRARWFNGAASASVPADHAESGRG